MINKNKTIPTLAAIVLLSNACSKKYEFKDENNRLEKTIILSTGVFYASDSILTIRYDNDSAIKYMKFEENTINKIELLTKDKEYIIEPKTPADSLKAINEWNQIIKEIKNKPYEKTVGNK